MRKPSKFTTPAASGVRHRALIDDLEAKIHTAILDLHDTSTGFVPCDVARPCGDHGSKCRDHRVLGVLRRAMVDIDLYRASELLKSGIAGGSSTEGSRAEG
jgi:hypothetical protein